MKTTRCAIGTLLMLLLTSCASGTLTTSSVVYHSVRSAVYKDTNPTDAKIKVTYYILPGQVNVRIDNPTDEIMIIDQTKSFHINNGVSTPFYNPTIEVTSNTVSNSNTKGKSLNLGAVAGALGIGGRIGTLANGISVSGADTEGYSTTNTTYRADQQQISIAPHGRGSLKEFHIEQLSLDALTLTNEMYNTYTESDSYCTFSVCISYSIDGGKTFNKLVTPFYVNSLIVSSVKKHGSVNEALRCILINKQDAIHEQYWILRTVDNRESVSKIGGGGLFFDWQ